MKKLIIATAITLALSAGSAFAVKGNDNPGNPGNQGQGGPPVVNPGNGGAGGNGGNGGAGGNGGNGGNGLGVGVGVGVGIANANASSKATATAGAIAAQQQGQLQGQGQIQGQTAAGGSATGGSNVGNSQSVTVTDSGQIHYSGDYKVKNTPDSYVVAPPSTASCMVGIGASFSGPGIGIGGAGAYESKECRVQEVARQLREFGRTTEAIAALCYTEVGAKVLPECQVKEPEKATVSGPAVSSSYSSPAVGSTLFAH